MLDSRRMEMSTETDGQKGNTERRRRRRKRRRINKRRRRASLTNQKVKGEEGGKVMCLSYWCFKPTQPQRIISGLRETFIKSYIIQRTSKAEQDLKNRVRKRRFVRRIYGMKYS